MIQLALRWSRSDPAKFAPKLGHIILESELSALDLGEDNPKSGKLALDLGEEIPELGKHALDLGEEIPRSEKHALDLRDNNPRSGRPALDLREEIPRSGKLALNLGQDFPSQEWVLVVLGLLETVRKSAAGEPTEGRHTGKSTLWKLAPTFGDGESSARESTRETSARELHLPFYGLLDTRFPVLVEAVDVLVEEGETICQPFLHNGNLLGITADTVVGKHPNGVETAFATAEASHTAEASKASESASAKHA